VEEQGSGFRDEGSVKAVPDLAADLNEARMLTPET
jgi:hypothetical protein